MKHTVKPLEKFHEDSVDGLSLGVYIFRALTKDNKEIVISHNGNPGELRNKIIPEKEITVDIDHLYGNRYELKQAQ